MVILGLCVGCLCEEEVWEVFDFCDVVEDLVC